MTEKITSETASQRIADYNSREFDAKNVERIEPNGIIQMTSGLTSSEMQELEKNLDSFKKSDDASLVEFAKKREEYLSRLKTDSRNKENIENDIKAAEREYRIAKERFDDVCKKPGFFARIFGGEKVASKEEIQVAKNEMKFREDYLNNQKTKVVSYTTILQHNGEGDF